LGTEETKKILCRTKQVAPGLRAGVELLLLLAASNAVGLATQTVMVWLARTVLGSCSPQLAATHYPPISGETLSTSPRRFPTNGWVTDPFQSINQLWRVETEKKRAESLAVLATSYLSHAEVKQRYLLISLGFTVRESGRRFYRKRAWFVSSRQFQLLNGCDSDA
jgi:hypothetical protein